MAHDALDPGPLSNFPHWPRNPDGSWDTTRMPTGLHRERGVLIDLTPRRPDGSPIVPPGMAAPS